MNEPTADATGPEHTSGWPERPAIGSASVTDTGTSSAVAVPQSVPYEVQAYPLPSRNLAYPTQIYGRTLPHQVYPRQPSDDAPWPLVSGEPPKPSRRRPSLLLTVVVALVLALAGAATAAFILIGPASSRGAAAPADAVEGFLDAIYGRHSAKDAARFVCERARDDQELDQTVFAVKTFEQEFTAARTTWTYPPIQQAGREASATVTLTMTTANEQVATKQVRLTLVDDRGWWVCDVQTPATQSTP